MRRQETKQEEWRVEYYKCRKKGHKYRECLLWRKKEQVERKPVYPVKEKVQVTERKMKQHIWLGHEKCSKENGGEVQHMSYGRRCRSIMKRTS